MPRPANAELQRRCYDELWRWLLAPDSEDQSADTPGPEFGRPEQGVSADEEAFGYGNQCPSG